MATRARHCRRGAEANDRARGEVEGPARGRTGTDLSEISKDASLLATSAVRTTDARVFGMRDLIMMARREMKEV